MWPARARAGGPAPDSRPPASSRTGAREPGPRRGAGPAARPLCRRRRGGPGRLAVSSGPRGRPCSTAHSARPSRPRPGATRGPRPRRRAARRRRGRVPVRRRRAPPGRRWARRGCGSPAAPALPAPPVERRTCRLVAGGATVRVMRGAAAATKGSSNWPSSGSSHPSAGTQSESTNATSAVCARAAPALRAPAGPTLVVSPTKRAPCRSAISLVAPASADASSTTMQAKPERAPRSRSSCAGRSRTGTTIVTSSSPRAPPAA